MSHAERVELSTDAAARWVVTTGIPFEVVKHPETVRFLKIIGFDVVLPGGTDMVQSAMMKYDYKIRKALVKAMSGQKIALTTDQWTSRAGQSYTAYTAHWIDETWEMHGHNLGCHLHEGRARGIDLLATLLKDMFISSGVDQIDITSVTGDTCPTMNLFGTMLQNTLGMAFIYCVAHTVQNTTKQAFHDKNFQTQRDVEGGAPAGGEVKVMSQARKLVTHFEHSTQKTEMLIDTQQKLRDNPQSDFNEKPVNVVQDVATRWCSTFSMLKRLLRLRPALIQLQELGE